MIWNLRTIIRKVFVSEKLNTCLLQDKIAPWYPQNVYEDIYSIKNTFLSKKYVKQNWFFLRQCSTTWLKWPHRGTGHKGRRGQLSPLELEIFHIRTNLFHVWAPFLQILHFLKFLLPLSWQNASPPSCKTLVLYVYEWPG